MIDVAAAIIIKDQQVLITRRAKGQNLSGKWEFPGGKIEEGETAQKCIERELREELSIKSKASEIFGEFIYNYNTGGIKLIGVITELINDSFVLSVHDKIEWVDIENLLSYDLAPADIPVANKITEIYLI